MGMKKCGDACGDGMEVLRGWVGMEVKLDVDGGDGCNLCSRAVTRLMLPVTCYACVITVIVMPDRHHDDISVLITVFVGDTVISLAAAVSWSGNAVCVSVCSALSVWRLTFPVSRSHPASCFSCQNEPNPLPGREPSKSRLNCEISGLGFEHVKMVSL